MIELKIKDLTEKEQASLVLDFASKKFFDDAIEELGIDNANIAMFRAGLSVDDPSITEKEIVSKINSADEKSISKYVNIGIDNVYNYIQVMSAPGDDGKEVYFAALTHINKPVDPIESIVDIAKELSKNKIQNTDIDMKDISVVVIETTPDGKLIPKPISIGDSKSE